MVVNKGENIGLTLQLIKSNGTSVEETATITYKILDNTGTIENVSEQTTTYNSDTKSYVDSLVPSASWSTQNVGSYLIVWSVSNTDDDFNDTYTEDLQVNIDKDKIDKILGLVHQNIFIDNTKFDRDGNMYGARLRIYSDSSSVGTTMNVLATYQITAQTTGIGKFSYWKQVEA
jgi:hypothetical protein